MQRAQRKFAKKWVVAKKRFQPRPMRSLVAKVNALSRAQESKWFDLTWTAPAAGLVTVINAVPQGDDSITRDGRKIVVKVVQLRYGLFGSAVPAGFIALRVVIVHDVAPNALIPAVTDIFTSSDGLAYNNLNNRERFRILYDFTLGQKKGSDSFVSTNASSTIVAFNDVVYKKCDISTVFNDVAGGTIGSITTGAIYVVTLFSGGSSVGSTLKSRIRFADA